MYWDGWVIYHSVGSSRRAAPLPAFSPITRTHAHAHAHAHKHCVSPRQMRLLLFALFWLFLDYTAFLRCHKNFHGWERRQEEKGPPSLSAHSPTGLFTCQVMMTAEQTDRTWSTRWFDHVSLFSPRESGVKWAPAHTPFCLPRAQQTLPT